MGFLFSSNTVGIRPIWDGLAASLILAITATLGIAGVWVVAGEHLRSEVRADLVRLASVVAANLDPELHDTLIDPAQLDGDDYRRALVPLRAMRAKASGIKYVYTLLRRDEKIRFVLDAAEPGNHDGDGLEDRSDLGEVHEDIDVGMLMWICWPTIIYSVWRKQNTPRCWARFPNAGSITGWIRGVHPVPPCCGSAGRVATGQRPRRTCQPRQGRFSGRDEP